MARLSALAEPGPEDGGALTGLAAGALVAPGAELEGRLAGALRAADLLLAEACLQAAEACALREPLRALGWLRRCQRLAGAAWTRATHRRALGAAARAYWALGEVAVARRLVVARAEGA